MLKLILQVDTPPPAEKTAKAKPALSPEDRVRNALELIDSGHRSQQEWILINKLYKSLKSKKQTPRVQNLIKMIEPVLAKFGYHGVSSGK